MEKKINVAIVGYGGMARCWHIKRLKEMTDIFEIVGAYDIDPERNRLFEEDSGVKAFSSMDELRNSGKVELAIVAVPNDVHKPVCIELLEHKINVICEKPVCLSSEELEAMIAAANKNGVVFTAHQNRRWDEDFLSVKKVYDENELGKIFRIESRVHGSRGIPGDWRNQKCHGGGMVLDWGIHLFDQLYCLTGWDDIVSVHADLTYVTNAEVDDGFSVTLKFKNGLVAFVEVGTSNFIELPRWYVQGENGSMVINDWNMNGKIVKVTDWENRDAVPVQTSAGMTKTMAPRTDDTIATFPIPRVPSDERDYYRNVAKAIRGEEKQLITHDQLRRTMKLMEAVFRSGETGEVIKETI